MKYVCLKEDRIASKDDPIEISYLTVTNDINVRDDSTIILQCTEIGKFQFSIKFPITTHIQLSKITLFYKILQPGLTISQIQIKQSGKALVLHDDSSIPNAVKITSYGSQISPPIQVNKSLNISLNLNCSETDGKIILCAICLTTHACTPVAAKNLCGIAVKPQKNNEDKFFIPFDLSKEEEDDKYCIQIETSWLTQKAITKKTKKGFYIEFEVPPPAEGTIDWLLIR